METVSQEKLRDIITRLPHKADIRIAGWHREPPVSPPDDDGTLTSLIDRDRYFNYQLWHVEDEARRTDVADSVIASVKRSIDRYNQQRNDAIEAIDTCLTGIIRSFPGYSGNCRLNSETAGSIIDRLHIISLKIFHMDEQATRTDIDAGHRSTATGRLQILQRQQAMLATCLNELIDDYLNGRRSIHTYHQFKMYNDPSMNPALYGGNGSPA